jgi:hypothetical protein
MCTLSCCCLGCIKFVNILLLMGALVVSCLSFMRLSDVCFATKEVTYDSACVKTEDNSNYICCRTDIFKLMVTLGVAVSASGILMYATWEGFAWLLMVCCNKQANKVEDSETSEVKKSVGARGK